MHDGRTFRVFSGDKTAWRLGRLLAFCIEGISTWRLVAFERNERLNTGIIKYTLSIWYTC